MTDYSTSDSRAQRQVEGWLIQEFFRKLGVREDEYEYNNTTSTKKEDVSFKFDAISEQHSVLVEVYARQGKLKSAQRHKVANDALKMMLYEAIQGRQYKKFFVFSCEDAKKSFQTGWRGSLDKHLDIRFELIRLPDDMRELVLMAQREQNMNARK